MANRRKPPRKSSHQKKQDSPHKPGGNRGHQTGNQTKRRPDPGKPSNRQQQTVANKISQTMKELPSAKETRSSSFLVKLTGFVAISLILFFGYFILMEYLDKTPVYGKHGWDDVAGQPATWEEAVEYCSGRRKRLPDKEELRIFSKRAEKKLKSLGYFWSTTPEGDKGNFQIVNLNSGESNSSPTTAKFAAICVK
ncbi:hypothetical protein LEP1GSC047_1126 [Leptospira inadai serovar Lyme str. 10]|uniref:DUF1566 domain-containing protein n=2 Tax=Leptospira inadai serovar Lyme TaxID=293084 RepID=V6HH83_9LEPT|nr:DUF1566 domain-containing protein [Leptospira inadai]EQA35600.1 hypothetical protein LEP1GSC047_1126 [Leptospira inadai serovar Lyme str. 10]PNV75882.1 hypothetical protein BES34_005050 [Leptospira inadai serovar Lyme]